MNNQSVHQFIIVKTILRIKRDLKAIELKLNFFNKEFEI